MTLSPYQIPAADLYLIILDWGDGYEALHDAVLTRTRVIDDLAAGRINTTYTRRIT